MPRTRQLAAIMFADMVGYTAIMQEDEHKAKQFRDRYREVIAEAINGNNGQTIQYYGDGTLSIFDSALEAVQSAIKIQQELLEDPKIPIRIGIHTGDIVRDEDGIYGDGVNIAARIESLSVSGCIMISDKVFDEIKNHKEIKTRSMGEFELKNVRRPIEVFAIANKPLIIPRRQDLQGKVKEKIKSIAVMPFVNMSADQENEYFSDGITEELINALTKVDGLQVTSRTSSFSFKGSSVDIREIGRRLNVQSILEGSVRKAGSKVRITAQLINSSDGYHFWSETYDRSLEDIFEVQDEISRKIANKLKEKLSASESAEPIIKAATTNMEAYNYYLKGRFESNKWTPASAKKAIDFYEKAVEEEPEFGLPYAYLASTYTFLGATGAIESGLAQRKVKENAEKAIKFQGDEIEAYIALGTIKIFMHWDWEAALICIQKAQNINPNAPNVRIANALYHVIKGDNDAAISEMLAALTVDPLSANTNRTLADFYYFLREYDKAIDLYDKILALDPSFRAAVEFKGWAYLQKGDYDKAIKIFENLGSETTHAIKPDTQLGYAYALMGEREKALTYLEKVKQRPDNINIDLATLYAGLGEQEEALKYIKKCMDEKLGAMVFLHVSPIWDPLKDHPDFQVILNEIGLNGN